MSEKRRLAIITTHPIQYNAPLFKLLAQRNNIDIKVFYTWGHTVLENKYDPGFGRIIKWDIPLLDGYTYEFVENTAAHKSSSHFKGIINPGLHAAVEKYKAQAVLIYGWPFVAHLKAMRYFKNRIPVLFRGDSTLLDNQKSIQTFLRSIFLRLVYRHINIALYAGKSNYDYFINNGLTGNQLVFAPHAVENERFAEKSENAIRVRKQFSMAATDIVFLFAGKLENKKGVQSLINAFILAHFNHTVHLLITGNGPLEEGLKKTAAGNTRIHFLDFQNQLQMPAVYQMCDVFVLPSLGPGETWGLAVNEAMAAGKPVIVSNKCGCAADLVIPGVTGWVFEAGNENELCGYLQWCTGNSQMVKEMGLQATKKISDYSFSAVAAAIEGLV